MQPDDDGALALAVRAGAPGAVERLVAGYGDALYTLAVYLLDDPRDAQEVAQDALIRACQALQQRYSAERCRDLALRPWLLRIARNLAHNRRRGNARRQAASLPAADGWHHDRLRDTTPLDASLLAREESARLATALACLRPASREVVLLRFVEDLSYAEIATVTGARSEAAVRGAVFRALRQLRTILEEAETDDDV